MWIISLSLKQFCTSSINIIAVITLRPRQDGRHFPDDIYKCIYFNENCCILIKTSLKYVHKGPIYNNPAFVQIMAWRRAGNKPLSEPVMAYFDDAYMRLSASMSYICEICWYVMRQTKIVINFHSVLVSSQKEEWLSYICLVLFLNLLYFPTVVN